MARVDVVKQKLVGIFGPASVRQVDSWVSQGMNDDEVIARARAKVVGLMGEKKAKELDGI